MATHNKHQAALLAFLVAAVSTIVLGTIASATSLRASLIAGFLGGNEEIHEIDVEQEQKEQFEREKPNELRMLKDRARECKDMSRQLKEITKKFPGEVGDLGSGVSAFCAAVPEAKRLVEQATDMDGLSEAREFMQENIHNATSELWEQLNVFQNRLNVLREVKGQKNTCKQWRREMKSIVSEGKRNKIAQATIDAFKQAAEARVSDCESAYGELKRLGDQGDWEAAQEVLQEHFWNNDWWQWVQEQRETILACVSLSQFVRDNERGFKDAQRMEQRFAKRGKDTSALRSVLSRASDFINEAKAIVQGGACEQDQTNDFQERLQELENDFGEALRALTGDVGSQQDSVPEPFHNGEMSQ